MAQEKVFPSAGHHDNDPGAVANGFIEMKEVDRIRNKVIDDLKSKNHSFETDKNHETNSRYQSRIKPIKGDVLLDIHLDAGSPTATGVGVFVHNNASELTLKAANELVTNLSKATGLKNRGVKFEKDTARGKIGILSKAGITVLVELAFITNIEDMRKLHDNEGCVVQVISEWLIKYDFNK